MITLQLNNDNDFTQFFIDIFCNSFCFIIHSGLIDNVRIVMGLLIGFTNGTLMFLAKQCARAEC